MVTGSYYLNQKSSTVGTQKERLKMIRLEKSDDITVFAHELVKYMQSLSAKEANQEDVKFALTTLVDALLIIDKYMHR